MRLGYKHDKQNDQIGSRYWTNTVLPLLNNGSLEKAVEGTYAYPNRIGLYPGMTCQFFCSFCGRNYNAKYQSTDIEKSFDVFKSVIDNDPKTDPAWPDRFRISGGLEPLTNPHIGKIISYGTAKGFKMQMYTNGYALTDTFLEKQPGIFDLEVMRVSLYGYDSASYYSVSKNQKGFDMVKNNLKRFCQISAERNSELKLGVNWIILPGRANDIPKVFDMIADINSVSDYKIKFITLREDFSQSSNYISDLEREKLHTIFLEMEKKYPDIHIDYGYALYYVRHDKPNGPLKMASHEEMDGYGFPQIATSVDSLGNLYVYHETGFLERPGSSRYIIGNIKEDTVENIVKKHLESKGIKPKPFDVGFLDAFDHTTTLLIHEAKQYKSKGLDWKTELEKKWKYHTQI